MTRHTLRAGTIHVGDWTQADLTPGYTLAIVDGPYGMSKAAWDRMGIDGLADWYAPHIARLSALLTPSASVYLWNTAEGWARIDPVMRATGWTFRRLIVWDKLNTAASMAWQKTDCWPETHEVAGFYTRGSPVFDGQAARSVWPVAIQGWADERLTTGTFRKGAKNQDGATCMVAEALHPTQKPLLFAERMIRASTRPGERVLVPFGGTCREAVVCEWMARTNPAEARGYDVCELNADGVDYIGPVLAQIRGEDVRPRAPGQVRLFG